MSVAKGVSDLTSTVVNEVTANPSGQLVVFGFSQGSSVSSQEKSLLANVADKSQYYFVLVGNPQRPNGGVIERLSAVGTVPFLNITFGLPTPTDTGIATTDLAYQYDGVADFPKYPVNLLADLNALAGVIYVHQLEMAPNGKQPNPLPYGYTTASLLAAEADPANQQQFGDTTYITIPATGLPLLRPLEALGAATGTSLLVTPLVDLTQPALQVLIETGYDRTNYGDPSPAALIPPINPITLATDLVAAVDLGLHNAVSNLGNTTPVPLAPYRGPGQSTTTSDIPTAATTSVAVAAPAQPIDQIAQARVKRKVVKPAAETGAATAAAPSGTRSTSGSHAGHRQAS
ncbi:PE-PPE domain-containing protein [Mycolicibacterium komossense]|uniref:PE-PPE domain-containing protein n=1 Tax=Mycolicibacterium komossense TaxID=1779 RepID=A0ABT3CCS3_9MYCO|nr:PE-PPE domain-containing protein [Mycolicibacterium komossense]